MIDKLKYYVKNNYGQEMLYVADPATAELVNKLTGKRTVSLTDIRVLCELLAVDAEEVIAPRK